MKIRPVADNVVLRLLPLPEQTESGLYLPQNREVRRLEAREAEVVAVGPGHYRGCHHCGHTRVFVPTTVRPGDHVLVDAYAGDHWSPQLDKSVPRHNGSKANYDVLLDERAEWRVVREEEIHGILLREEAAAE